MWYSKTSWSTAKKQTYNGKYYDSKFEAGYAQQLDLRIKAGEVESFETHVPIPLIVNGYKIGTYYIDFVVYRTDGITEYVETKGRASEVWKMKWKIFEATYSDLPDVELSVVWQGKRKPMRKIKKV